MKPWIKGCLVAAVAVAAVLLVLVLVTAPVAVREGRKVVEPIRKMERAGKRLEDLTKEKAWKKPSAEVITAEQLQRFLAVRRALDEVYRRFQPRVEKFTGSVAGSAPPGLRPSPTGSGLEFPQGHAKSLREGLEALETMSELVPAQLDVFVEADMPPREYHWIQKIVYGRWRPALRAAGVHPEAYELAAREVEAAADAETDEAVAARLRELAGKLRQTRPPAPEGFDEATHALLLSHVEEIERYSLDAFRDIPAPPPP